MCATLAQARKYHGDTGLKCRKAESSLWRSRSSPMTHKTDARDFLKETNNSAKIFSGHSQYNTYKI